jgi:hypothetical protein
MGEDFLLVVHLTRPFDSAQLKAALSKGEQGSLTGLPQSPEDLKSRS